MSPFGFIDLIGHCDRSWSQVNVRFVLIIPHWKLLKIIGAAFIINAAIGMEQISEVVISRLTTAVVSFLWIVIALVVIAAFQ